VLENHKFMCRHGRRVRRSDQSQSLIRENLTVGSIYLVQGAHSIGWTLSRRNRHGEELHVVAHVLECGSLRSPWLGNEQKQDRGTLRLSEQRVIRVA
jgi:hypothetical protein